MTDGNLTVPIVLGWNLKHLRDVVDTLTKVGPEIETEMVSAATRIDKSDEYFIGEGGDAARTRGATDKTDGLGTVDVYAALADEITGVCNTFQVEIARMQIAAAKTAASKWDLFYKDDGEVVSRKSNWETAKSNWMNPVSAIAAKELEETVLTRMFREALANVLEQDAKTASIAGVLEKLTDSVKIGMANIPTDPKLANILLNFQVNPEDMEVWPSGIVLQSILAVDPTFTPDAMTKSEVTALEKLLVREGPAGLVDFYSIKKMATQAANESDFSATVNDGQGDAFRHTYWNALLTRRFGETFADEYATSHEGGAGQPSHREAMDLYNNSIGRQIGADNPTASPEDLKSKVTQAINDGKAVIIGKENPGATPQIMWSNQIPKDHPELQGLPTDLYVPLPGKQ
ncbi:DUF6973 domain-containing protein [Nocardia sp. NPDC056100]|uniref:DUF6973 domain-containing protein n=1 Tax=Nocardia sp. NPDC056100 TaxID=3345712 RepID=UPI0035DE6958